MLTVTRDGTITAVRTGEGRGGVVREGATEKTIYRGEGSEGPRKVPLDSSRGVKGEWQPEG